MSSFYTGTDNSKQTTENTQKTQKQNKVELGKKTHRQPLAKHWRVGVKVKKVEHLL